MSEQLEASHVNCITGTGFDVKSDVRNPNDSINPPKLPKPDPHTSPEENDLVGDMNCTVLGSQYFFMIVQS